MNEEKTIIRKVLVGSRLHELFNEQSDYDYRGIFMPSLKSILSPYRKNKNTSWEEGKEDNTFYELANFCKYASQGNMTILEILWSDKIKITSEIGENLYRNRHKFSDSKRIFEASRGYASNQLAKMDISNPTDRTPKFIVSYIRVMQQGAEFLRTGELSCRINQRRDFLQEVKWNFRPELVADALKVFQELEKDIVMAYEENRNKMIPDIDWIESFILESYKNQP